MNTLDEKNYNSEKKRRRGIAHNHFEDTSLFVPVQNDDGDSKNNDLISFIYKPPQSFFMAYFGVKPQPKIV
jgi:hypothetical protein